MAVSIYPSTAAAVRAATRALARRPERILAVFDIDSTILSRRHRRIAAVCSLLHWIKARGGMIYIVTARPEEGRRATEDTLAALGVDTAVRGLYMPPERLPSTAAVAAWKHSMRRRIARREARPLTISVGDNLHDLSGVPFRSIGRAALIGSRHTQLGLLVKD